MTRPVNVGRNAVLFLCLFSLLNLTVELPLHAFAMVSVDHPLRVAPAHVLESFPAGLAVNTFNANLFYTRSDLSLNGVPGFSGIAFYYNSALRRTNGGFGPGWSASFDIRVSTDAVGDATVRWGDGHEEAFERTSRGFAAARGIRAVLTAEGDGTYFLVTPEGNELRFLDSSHGKITSSLARSKGA